MDALELRGYTKNLWGGGVRPSFSKIYFTSPPSLGRDSLGVGHSRDILGLGNSGTLWGWALQGESGLEPLWGWALADSGAGHSGDTPGWTLQGSSEVVSEE